MSDAIVVPSADEPTAPAGIFRALRHRNYRLFFAGQLVSLVGNFLTALAMAWLVYDLARHSAHPERAGLWLGVVGFAGQIPVFLLAPFAGVWVDRLPRRPLLVTTQALSMLQSFALAALAKWHVSYDLVVLLALFQGLVYAFDIPGRQAFLVDMIEDRADLPNAIALNSSMVHLARLLGPALAGFLIYYVGEYLCFLLDGFSYIGVIIALLAMRLRPIVPRANPCSVMVELREGVRYVWGSMPMRAILLLMAVVSLTVIPAFTTLAPIFADALSSQAAFGSRTLGFIMGASGVGALIGSIQLASRKTVLGLGRVIPTAAAGYGVAVILFALAQHLPVAARLPISLLIVACGGYAMITTFASSNTLLQTLAEDDKRGRVMSFFSMAFMGMTPFGNLIVGWASKLAGGGVAGASRAMYGSATITLVAAVVFVQFLPMVRRFVRPIYITKGILPAVAAGLKTTADATTTEPVSA